MKKFSVFFVFLMFLFVSCDDGLKFENPLDPNNQGKVSDGIKPPKPLIHVAFEYAIQYPMSYRSILDKVQMNLKSTCVSDPDDPKRCLDNWEEKYYIRYKWEMTESPTPDLEESQLKLTEGDAKTGEWLMDDDVSDNPKKAAFTPLVTTPVRYEEPNDSFDEHECTFVCGKEPSDDWRNRGNLPNALSEYFICRQKYCEKNVTKYYKINIQAETVDKKTKVLSDTAEVTLVPRIIPSSRVAVNLSWKQGFRSNAETDSEEGTIVDLDLHFIKKRSIEAQQYGFNRKEGLMGTAMKTGDNYCFMDSEPECEKYYRHDDCSFADPGHGGYDTETILWYASLDIDNSWGGGDYTSPEVISMGPIDDSTNDGIPDIDIFDDQYLVVVNYSNCSSLYSDGFDRCAPEYNKDDGAYEVDANVDIVIDGESAPREGTYDQYNANSKNFKIKLNEWKVVAVIKWDNQLGGPESMPKYRGNAIVTDTAMPDFGITVDPKNYPVCTFDTSDANLIPIWDTVAYYEHITTVNETGIVIGQCDKEPILDECPNDPDKAKPGVCGCGIPDIDSDDDGILDCEDNCPADYNPDQLDSDGDYVGDTCDNCPDYPNPFQVDENGNGIGDVCEDDDNDGVSNYGDNCPADYNPVQEDADGDGVGDACDNCPDYPNPSQDDSDGNGIGDVCEESVIDPDNDGVENEDDNCPNTPNADQLDSDGDGVGDVCDNCPLHPNWNQDSTACAPETIDPDDDGFENFEDNCPYTANSYRDSEGNVIRDANGKPVQDDTDGDGVGDACDNCINYPNRDQKDTDGNGKGDACEYDAIDKDHDGVEDLKDNCPPAFDPETGELFMDPAIGNAISYNPYETDPETGELILDANGKPYQLDSDGDGIGDACDYCDGNNNEGCEQLTCIPTSPEICGNNVDEDCAGGLDNGCEITGCVPSREICDGIDNDCDGAIDEGCGSNY